MYAALHNREHPQLAFDMHQMYRDGVRFMVPPFIDPLEDRFALLAAPETIDFRLLMGVLLVACIGVSAAGSAITLRRFLRV